MSKVTISGNASGTGTLLIAAPNTNSDITLNLPTTMGTNNGSSVVTTDAAGNLGLGVAPSAWGAGQIAMDIGFGSALWNPGTVTQTQLLTNSYFNNTNFIYKGTGSASRYRMTGAQHEWHTAPSGTAGAAISFVQAMTLDASGNLGVGTTSPTTKLHVFGSGANSRVENSGATNSTQFSVKNTVGTVTLGLDSSTGGGFGVANAAVLWYDAAQPLVFGTSNTERARIDSSGNLLVGVTATVANAVFVASKSVTDYVARFINSNSSGYGVVVNYSGASPNSTGQEFLRCVDSTTDRMTVRSNGGIANFSANNVNLSDERTKKDIENAGDYLSKICAIPVRTFKYKDQTDELLNLGVIAQEVEAVAPELVDVSGFGETPEDGVPLKAIYQTDLQYALMKCIQELKAIVDGQAILISAQGAEIATLTAAVAASKGTA